MYSVPTPGHVSYSWPASSGCWQQLHNLNHQCYHELRSHLSLQYVTTMVNPPESLHHKLHQPQRSHSLSYGSPRPQQRLPKTVCPMKYTGGKYPTRKEVLQDQVDKQRIQSPRENGRSAWRRNFHFSADK